MTTKALLDRLFNDPGSKYGLSEFETADLEGLEKELEVFKIAGKGRGKGKNTYFLKSLAPLYNAEQTSIHVYTEGGKEHPEELIRQLWVKKLTRQYGYSLAQIELDKPQGLKGTPESKKTDLLVYSGPDRKKAKIVFEIRKTNRKDGIDQLKSYLDAEICELGVWSNGNEKVILYRPHPSHYATLPDIPTSGQSAEDLQDEELTINDLEHNFDFKKILLELEELVLGSSGVNVFNEVFKLIYAKIWDEKQALEVRPAGELRFKWFANPERTYERIHDLFRSAAGEWQGVFEVNDRIKLQPEHLNVCVAPLVRKRFLGSSLRIIDDAFEYLLPAEARKKKGQFFTPRYVIDMCVRILNPKQHEYVLDPACGSAGFLIHAMNWAWPAHSLAEMEQRKRSYASQYLWGIDFEEQAAKISRALMLIAGNGNARIFGPEVDTLDPETWYRTGSGKALMHALEQFELIQAPITESETPQKEASAWQTFEKLRFDVILSNPPFSGEIKVKRQLSRYDLARPALKRAKNKQAKEERDVLFIERIIKMLKPGGRAAIVLPQGKFNNSSLAFVRQWILEQARILAVIGLHVNTFKPHTGTKTSVLVLRKYTEEELQTIQSIRKAVQAECPDIGAEIQSLLAQHPEGGSLTASQVPAHLLAAIPGSERTEPSIRKSLETILQDKSQQEALKQQFIKTETARRMDYPIFMAISEQGGKNNSGEYVHRRDEAGNIIRDINGNPLIDQDLVNYALSQEALQEASTLPPEQMAIAESFIRFAKAHHFDFWQTPSREPAPSTSAT